MAQQQLEVVPFDEIKPDSTVRVLARESETVGSKRVRDDCNALLGLERITTGMSNTLQGMGLVMDEMLNSGREYHATIARTYGIINKREMKRQNIIAMGLEKNKSDYDAAVKMDKLDDVRAAKTAKRTEAKHVARLKRIYEERMATEGPLVAPSPVPVPPPAPPLAPLFYAVQAGVQVDKPQCLLGIHTLYRMPPINDLLAAGQYVGAKYKDWKGVYPVGYGKGTCKCDVYCMRFPVLYLDTVAAWLEEYVNKEQGEAV